jgi:hypothetical protein
VLAQLMSPATVQPSFAARADNGIGMPRATSSGF